LGNLGRQYIKTTKIKGKGEHSIVGNGLTHRRKLSRISMRVRTGREKTASLLKGRKTGKNLDSGRRKG